MLPKDVRYNLATQNVAGLGEVSERQQAVHICGLQSFAKA